MNKAVKSIILGSLSLSLLAGCSDDKKDDPFLGVDGKPGVPGINGGKPGQGGQDGSNGSTENQYFVVYGSGSSNHSLLQIADKDGSTADIDANGSAGLTNATVTALNDNYNDDGINVVTRAGDDITVSSSTITGQIRDLENSTVDGSLQFDIKVNTLRNKGANLFLSMSSDSLVVSPAADLHEADINISSAIHASTAADTQSISIPLSCFTDLGIDFSKSVTQFALTNTADINYDLSNIRYVSNSLSERHDLPCSTLGETLWNNNEDRTVFSAFRQDPGVDGWATEAKAWGPATVGYPDKWRSITFSDNAENGQNGGMWLELNPGETSRDLSRYVENGALEILLEVENYAEHPNKVLDVRMEGSANSVTYSLPEGFAEGQQDSYIIPLKELFTNKVTGQIDHVVLQNIKKALVIQPQPINEDASLKNIAYKVGEVKLIWDYSPEPEA